MPWGGEGELWALVLYFALAALLVLGMLGISAILGEQHGERATDEPYEAGVVPTGGADAPVSVKFYLIALVFLIFDLEAAFVLVWSVAVRELGWAGFASMLVFVGVLLVALAYLWRTGALDWGTSALFARRRRALRLRRRRAAALGRPLEVVKEDRGEVVARSRR